MSIVHRSAQNISKELTKTTLNVVHDEPGCGCSKLHDLVIAMCVCTETPHYLFSMDVYRHVKNALGPGNVVQLVRVLVYYV